MYELCPKDFDSALTIIATTTKISSIAVIIRARTNAAGCDFEMLEMRYDNSVAAIP